MIARGCLIAVCAGVIFAQPLQLRAEATSEQVRALFARSTKVTPSAMRAAREHYDKLTIDGNGPLVDYAFALVLIEQHQLQEAGQLLAALVKATPGSAPPRRTLIWVQMARKDYAAALLEMETLAAILARQKTITTDTREGARFLGTAIGFLSGPASSPKIVRMVADARNQVAEKLGKALQPEFDNGFLLAGELFASLQNETAAAKEEATQIQAEAIRSQTEQVEGEKAAIDEARQDLEAKADARKQETQAELDALNEKLSELQKQYSDVMARGAPLQAQISAAQAEISALTQLVQQEDGSQVIVYRDPDRARFLERLIAQLQIQLAPMQAELNAINFRVADLRNKNAVLLRQHNIDLQKMFGEGQKLAKSQTRLERIEKATSKAKATGESTRTRTLSARMTTFGTYEPFPMEKEKDRVLRALK